jgi:hypothetical protein
MHLGVDDAGQDMEVAGVHKLGGSGSIETADGGNAPCNDADVALADAVMVDDSAALDQDIVMFGHPDGSSSACTRGRARIPKSARARSLRND